MADSVAQGVSDGKDSQHSLITIENLMPGLQGLAGKYRFDGRFCMTI